MIKPYYTGTATEPKPGLWKLLPEKRKFNNETGYIAQAGLIDAVNVALTLNQPLLLTGEPGTGKSTLARSLSFELGCEDHDLKVEIKSTTTAKDLFYTFDHIGWFNTRHIEEKNVEARDFLRLTGLGKAIFDAAANPPQKIAPNGYLQTEQKRSVVLIDEIDKAPRDVPNDLLNEIEHLYFKVPEIDNTKVEADPKFRPIIIITSNSEKSLPDAFLRRCIFYNIDLPDNATLMKILHSRFKEVIGDDDLFLKEAINLMHTLRNEKELDKKPGVAELIDFVAVTKPLLKNKERLSSNLQLVQEKISCLLKNPISAKKRERMLENWKQEQLSNAN